MKRILEHHNCHNFRAEENFVLGVQSGTVSDGSGDEVGDIRSAHLGPFKDMREMQRCMFMMFGRPDDRKSIGTAFWDSIFGQHFGTVFWDGMQIEVRHVVINKIQFRTVKHLSLNLFAQL